MEHETKGEWLVRTGLYWDPTSLIITYYPQNCLDYISMGGPSTTSHTTPGLRWFESSLNYDYFESRSSKTTFLKKYLK